MKRSSFVSTAVDRPQHSQRLFLRSATLLPTAHSGIQSSDLKSPRTGGSHQDRLGAISKKGLNGLGVTPDLNYSEGGNESHYVTGLLARDYGFSRANYRSRITEKYLDGDTVLHRALKNGDFQVVKFLFGKYPKESLETVTKLNRDGKDVFAFGLELVKSYGTKDPRYADKVIHCLATIQNSIISKISNSAKDQDRAGNHLAIQKRTTSRVSNSAKDQDIVGNHIRSNMMTRYLASYQPTGSAKASTPAALPSGSATASTPVALPSGSATASIPAAALPSGSGTPAAAPALGQSRSRSESLASAISLFEPDDNGEQGEISDPHVL